MTDQLFTDSDGNLAKSIDFNADDSTTQTIFNGVDGNGDPIAQSVITRDASGDITSDAELQSDGSTIETQFTNGVESNEIFTDANGDLTKTIAVNPDGSSVQTDFGAPDANGNQIAQSVITRDASGDVTDDKELQSDGSTIETQFANGAETNELFTNSSALISRPRSSRLRMGMEPSGEASGRASARRLAPPSCPEFLLSGRSLAPSRVHSSATRLARSLATSSKGLPRPKPPSRRSAARWS